MSWQVEFNAGVWLPEVGWWLDAQYPRPRSFVSHAHFDHLAAHGEVLCSAGTSRLMQARLPAKRIEHVLPFGQTERLDPSTVVTLHPAGHIHGSAQCLLEHERLGSLLYTGDFKLRPGRSAEICATPRADTVIMETTFGRPQYVFPPTERILADIAAFCHAAIADGEVPVLFGYSLGKSQELLCGLTEARLPVMLHPQTLRLTRIYEELGISMPPHRGFDAEESPGHVVICPPQSRASAFLRKIPRRRTAAITGWAMDPNATFRYQCDAAFPLSDHADFPDLLRFVEAVNPRRVLTLHGFAREFAATLRERGIEAWAIGEENQLELGITRTASALYAEAASADPDPRNTGAAAAPDALRHLTTTADAIHATPQRTRKVELLANYLAALPEEAAGQAAVFFSARAFPQSDARTLGLGWALLKRAILEAAGLGEAEYRAQFRRFPDAGDATAAMFASRQPRGAPVSLGDLAAFLAAVAAEPAPAAKLERTSTLLPRLSPAEAKYLVKLITGDLRIGLKEGLIEEAIALATSRPVESVREANMLCGDLAAVTRAARAGRLGDIQLRVFHPLQFMLASPEPTAEAIISRLGAPVWLEEKYDGIRCQAHKLGDRVELYSRDLKRITAQFPDLSRNLAGLPDNVILDGELLAWRDGRALPFAELQRRLGRKGDDFFLGAEVPVSFCAYDLLWLDGVSLLARPLRERRASLESIATRSTPESFLLAPRREAADAVEIEAAFLAAKARGNEGLMAKDPVSPYTPGRRGLAWLKLKKAAATLDVVVVAVEFGHGRRRDVLSDYTFAIRDDATGRLLNVGKAYSGLTDEEIARLTAHFLERTLEERGRRRLVVPDVVLEIAFDSIQPSDRHDSGFALRFPRIARIRTDKTPAEIDTLSTCRRLAGTSFGPTPPLA